MLRNVNPSSLKHEIVKKKKKKEKKKKKGENLVKI